MSKNGWTPGPWKLVAGDDYLIEATHYPDNFPHKFKDDDLGPHVAIIGNRTPDFGEANARLIVALGVARLKPVKVGK